MSSLSIGDFARATHLTVKMLRHYHEVGLLEPAEVDPGTGYRRYSLDQLRTAQVIRRFRDLDMPLEQIRAVLGAEDPAARTERIAAHLRRLEEQLGRTQRTVASLRDLIDGSAEAGLGSVELRTVPAQQSAVITAVVSAAQGVTWMQGALGELYGTLAGHGVAPSGSPGAMFDDELFTQHRGTVTAFAACSQAIGPTGRVTMQVVPQQDFAVVCHAGSPSDVDRAYATLAAYVAKHALAVDAPIREYYRVGLRDTPDVTRWRTDVCWPVFRIG